MTTRSVSSDHFLAFMRLSTSESRTHTTSTESTIAVSKTVKTRRRPVRARPHVRVYPKVFSVMTVITSLIAFLTGYFLAAFQQRTDWFLPFISDGGAFSPEANIFGFFLSIGGYCWIFTVFAIHIRINMHIRSYNKHYISMKKRISIYIMDTVGIMSGLGVVMVGCYQEVTLIDLHYVGAFFAFVGGVFYIWMFLLNTCFLKPQYSPRWLTLTRLAFVIICTVAFFGGIASLTPESFPNNSTVPKPYFSEHDIERYPWGSKERAKQIIKTMLEWCVALCFLFVIFTMTYELNSFTLSTTGLRKRYYKYYREVLRDIRRKLRNSKKLHVRSTTGSLSLSDSESST
ncbi:unnamed protein product [Bursaphelenchus okinawaensis]|uniref:CWH43-like N-terminal domain-containing protein n=1 Tax=Bursaphelenchus okinawaensis TaxID=465554 RepID=A0A811LG61_9BILA|nr:unnamed protein product [Bursaphelenchus okinawaensis]CAG9124561.1 unnamed protein product [Bursaphelenchus okinawaensis]